MEIDLASHVGQRIVATLRDGSALAGLLTDDGPSPFVYRILGRSFSRNGRWGRFCYPSDGDIVYVSSANLYLDKSPNPVKDLLTLLFELTNSCVMKPPFHFRKKDNGDFVLSIVEDIESDFGSRWRVVDTVVFSKDGEVTVKGSTTVHDLLRKIRKAKALAKLTVEEREILGL